MIFISETVTGSEPVSAAVQKAWSKVDFTDDDTLIGSLITETRDIVEKYLGISIIDKTLVLTLTDRDSIQLPYGPVIAISSIVDEDDTAIEYEVLNEKVTFSSTVTYAKITYTVGWTTVPSGLIIGLKRALQMLYENRGEQPVNSILSAIQELRPYRRKLWF